MPRRLANSTEMAKALITPTVNSPKIHLQIEQAVTGRLISSPFENVARAGRRLHQLTYERLGCSPVGWNCNSQHDRRASVLS